MPKTVPILTRVSPELKAKVRSLARDTKRSEAYVAKEAIEAYIALNEYHIDEITESIRETEAGLPGVSHKRMSEWLKSWGTPDELPPPEPDKRP